MKVTNKIFIIALMLSLIFSVSAVVAQEDMTFNQSDIQSVDVETDLGMNPEESQEISDVDSLLGEVENQKLGEGNEKTVEGDNFTSIQTTINSASSGDTIFLGGKTYNGSSTITVNKEGLTIIGGSSHDDDTVATLDGEDLIQIMKITASNVVIKGIKFINAKSNADGGAVQWSGDNGVVKNSAFINNNAKRYGGAIYWSGKNASVEGCQFERNVATGQNSATGGAIFFDGINATLKNSNFINNTANYAGAVHISHANSKVVDCLFENNTATYMDAGALRWFGSDGEIINSRFINNSAVNIAGAVYMHSISNVRVSDSTFINNAAGSHGGAIYSNAANTTVSNSRFFKNTGNNGGAIFINKDSMSVIDSNFTDNSAGGTGGAIIFESNAINSKVYNSKFENNVAESNHGGAIFSKSDNGIIKDCEFNNNFSLKSGGAIRIENKAFNISNSYFAHNHVMNSDGGAIYWLGSEGAVSDCTFVNNSASTYAGGAIYVNANADNFKISNSKFSKNSAKTYGGALVSYDDNTNISHCNFTDNTGANGGALHFDGSSKVIANCNFIDNTATSNGGAIRAGGINVNNITLTDCIFKNNKALGTGAGGAVLWYAFNSVISECKFINNSAYSGGAVNLESNAQNYYKESRNTTLSNCIFEDNHAGSAGGAIRWLGVEGKINACNFTNNSAGSVLGTSSNGGAIFFHSYSRDTILSNSNFINNSCEGNGGSIHWAGVNGTLTNCNISGSSSYNGGAVYWNGADGKLMDSSISNANASNTGGAIYWNAVNADVSNCEFERNYAKNYAGAIIFSSNALNAKVSNSNITRNGAGISTGGIRCEGANASVSNCSFTNNYAVTGGSAAFYVHASNCKLSDSSFINNTAFNDAGAVLWNSNGYNGTLTNCEFINNTAGQYGGGLYWNCPDGVLRNASFANNSARDGGGLYWSGANAQISDCHFTNNSANLTGGAALVRGDNGNLSNCEFTDNSAGTLTGGLYWFSSYGTVSNCNFTGNSAGTNNGALGINSGATNVTVTGSKFENNKARDLGGAFHWNGPNGKLDNCSFINNTAVDGGASYWNGADGTLNNCEFVNNSASSSGAIHWRGNNGNINGSTFTANTAELGGAVHTTADGVTISQNNFVNNTGIYSGSALWIDGDNNQIRNNDIVNNDSTKSPTYVTDSKNTVFEGNTGDVAYHNAQIIMEVADVFVGYVGRTLTIPIYIHDDLGVPLSGEVNIQNYGAQQLVNGRANFTIEMPESEQLIGLLVYYEKINRNIEVDVVDPSDAIDDIVQPERMGKDEIIIELPVNAKGNVTVTVNNKEYVASVINGTAVIEFNDLKNGVYPATVFYSGDGVYDNMTKEFNLTIKYSQINPQTALLGNKDVSVIYSGTGIYSVLVFKYGKLVGAGESVTFNFNGKNTVVKTDANSYATFKFSADAKVGKHTIKATYFGTTVTNKVNIAQIIKASNKKVKKSAKVTKVKITLNKVNGKFLSKKVLKIKFNKKTYKVKTNNKGVAIWKVKKSMLKKLKVGKKVKYTVTYGKAVLTKKLTIKK